MDIGKSSTEEDSSFFGRSSWCITPTYSNHKW